MSDEKPIGDEEREAVLRSIGNPLHPFEIALGPVGVKLLDAAVLRDRDLAATKARLARLEQAVGMELSVNGICDDAADGKPYCNEEGCTYCHLARVAETERVT